MRDMLGVLDAGLAGPTPPRAAAAEHHVQEPDPQSHRTPLKPRSAARAMPAVKARLEAARAAAVLVSDRARGDKLAAIAVIAALRQTAMR